MESRGIVPIFRRARQMWIVWGGLAGAGVAVLGVLGAITLLSDFEAERATSAGLMMVDIADTPPHHAIDDQHAQATDAPIRIPDQRLISMRTSATPHPNAAESVAVAAEDSNSLPVADVHRDHAPRVNTGRDDAPVAEQQMTFGGRRLVKVREIPMTVTAYSPDARSCGKWADGVTASGYSVWTNGMKLAAADTDLLPFKTIVTVPGYNEGRPVQVLDRGGAIKGRRLDVLHPSHEAALQWGRQNLTITVWKYAE